MHEPTLGSLFSGCGGLDLGLERGAGLVTRWQCQYDPDSKREQPCNGILERHWPGVVNLGDITAVDWTAVEPVDVLAGGFPCQDLSYAGRGAGIADGARSRLWFEFAHAIRALRPRVVVVENVPGLITRGLGVVLADLAEAGYDASWGSIRAADVGAPHRRERVFLIAADAERLRVNADRRLRGGGQGEHAGPARAAVPAGAEVACAANAVEDRAGVASDAERERLDGCRERDPESTPSEGTHGRGIAAGSAEASADAGSDGLVRLKTLDGAHAEVDVEPRHDADGCGVGGAGAHDGHDREAPADAEHARPSREGSGTQSEGALDGTLDGRAEEVAADADGEHGEPRLERRTPRSVDARAGTQEHNGDGHMGTPEQGPVEWGVYEQAVRQWEAIFGYLAPRPTDDRGRLAPEFVEWMLGYPAGWTAGVSRTARLKMLGNSVQVQVAEVVAVAVAISLEATS